MTGEMHTDDDPFRRAVGRRVVGVRLGPAGTGAVGVNRWYLNATARPVDDVPAGVSE